MPTLISRGLSQPDSKPDRFPTWFQASACNQSYGRRQLRYSPRINECYRITSLLRFNAAAFEEKIPPMASAMGLDDSSFDAFYKAICQKLALLENPKTLVEIGVPADCAAAIAVKALQDSAATTNPRQATVEEFQMVIEEAPRHGR